MCATKSVASLLYMTAAKLALKISIEMEAVDLAE